MSSRQKNTRALAVSGPEFTGGKSFCFRLRREESALQDD